MTDLNFTKSVQNNYYTELNRISTSQQAPASVIVSSGAPSQCDRPDSSEPPRERPSRGGIYPCSRNTAGVVDLSQTVSILLEAFQTR
jgi:hypothetical protein